MSQNRRFTADEDQRIETLRIQGATLRAIAATVGRWHSSVQLRLQTLARKAEEPIDAVDQE